nr:acylneuraminate cytidylyltransferase family protein [uncultured Dyadobacter sp.]
MKSKTLGLIPARMGSKGIPGKNMKVLGGKPLIQYTIESAQQSDLLHTLAVSTDSSETSRFARQFHCVAAPFLRPDALATDHTPMIEVVRHAIDYYGSAGHYFDFVVLLQPTSPFRKPGLIDKAIRQILDQGADSLVTVRKIPEQFNPHWAYQEKENFLEKKLPGTVITRRQDLPTAYSRDGQIYITRTTLIQEGIMTGGKISALIDDHAANINIDTHVDWIRAENMIQEWNEKQKAIS